MIGALWPALRFLKKLSVKFEWIFPSMVQSGSINVIGGVPAKEQDLIYRSL